MPPKILGISGTNGSGKDTVAHLLEQDHNFLFISVSDLLRDELKKQSVPLTREATRNLSVEWRRKFGNGVLIDKAKETYDASGGDQSFKGLVIASLRNPAEADSVHQLGGMVLWLDGDIKARFERIKTNQNSRGSERQIVDNVTFEQFQADEMAEMGERASSDPSTLSLRGVKAKSDLSLINEGTSLSELRDKLDTLLGFSAH